MFRFHNVNLTSLNFLHVTNISDYSFVTCKNLCYAHLPKVQKIGSYAFADCTRLKELTASHDLTTINYMAFFQCTRLSTVDVGPNVVVDRNAFSECDELLRLASLAKVSTDTGDYSRGGFNDPTRGVVKVTIRSERSEAKPTLNAANIPSTPNLTTTPFPVVASLLTASLLTTSRRSTSR